MMRQLFMLFYVREGYNTPEHTVASLHIDVKFPECENNVGPFVINGCEIGEFCGQTLWLLTKHVHIQIDLT